MTDAIFSYPDHTYMRVRASDDALHDLDDRFTFQVDGAQHMPLVRERVWDGKIHLFKVNSGYIYRGLKSEVVSMLEDSGYVIDDSAATQLGFEVADDFIANLKLNKQPRDYQDDAFKRAMRQYRAVILSPTASGKSLIIYLMAQQLLAKKQRTLLIVPTINLVNQMAKDFLEYGGVIQPSVHKISGGKEKDSLADVVITTWQSIANQPSKWYRQFGGVIADEVHQYKAKSLIKIMESADSVPFRIGLTGTLDDIKNNELTIRGLFGDIFRTKKTSELIERGDIAPVRIHMCTLTYGEQTKEAFWRHYRKPDGKPRKPTYQEEIEFLLEHDLRFTFVSKLARALKGTTLLLFRYKEAHGKKLYETIKAKRENVFYVSGDIKGDAREVIRQHVMNNPGCLVIASIGTFATGVNIPNIDNIILAHPLKTKITLLQSIGRGLRLSEGKDMCHVYDVVDDISTSRTRRNYVFNHAYERLRHYIREDFPVTHHPYRL